MTELTAYLLHPIGPWHLAERGVGIEETADFVRSDTLFSALCCAVRLGWGEDELLRFLAPFRADDPPFLLTSAFPFSGGIRFLPIPRLPLPSELPDDVRSRIRQTRWVSTTVFDAWRHCSLTLDMLHPTCFLLEYAVWLAPSEERLLPESYRRGTPLWARDVTPRVTVDRTANASQVFRAGHLRFGPESGLHLLVAWRDPAWRPLVEGALRELGLLGLGGLRSTGHGQFRLAPAEPLLLERAASGVGILLSLYAPSPRDLEAGVLGPRARYDLVVRSGWISSPDGASYRRKELHFLTEGSLVDVPADAPVLGQLVDVTPDVMRSMHPVYRYGYAFLVPAFVEGEDR